MEINVKSVTDNANDLLANVIKLTKKEVLVGVPSDEERVGGGGTNVRTGSEINNATLAYIHNYGSPARNIPARPFIEPGINNVKDQTVAFLRSIATKVLEGNTSSIMQDLHSIGLLNVASMQNVIEAGIPPPLKASTKRARLAKNKGLSKSKKATIMSNDDNFTPLKDTGQLLKSLGYVIRDKE